MTNASSTRRTRSPRLAAGTTVAVTGASGFIGGRLVERLSADGAAVTCFLRGHPGPALRATDAAFHALDLADAAAVETALRDVALVFHCAYDWSDESWNRRALAALIDGCRANGCGLIHVSSFVVYDVPPEGDLTEEVAGTTDRAGYAHVKTVMERDLIAAVRMGDLFAAIVQPTIVYGPGSKPWTIEPAEMLRHGTLVLPDRGEGVCNAVYVDDVVDAMILTAQTPEAAGRRFLVSGEPITWGRFFEALAMAADAKPPAYLPVEAIRHEHKQRVGLAGLFRSPTMLLRRLAQRRSVGGLLRRASRLMPRPTRAHVERQLLGPLERRRAYRHLPDPGRLGLYQGRAVVSSGRARRELGYAPRVDLAAGMEITRRYLSTYFDRL